LHVVTETQHAAVAAPRHWAADVLLRDGRTAHIRPIRPDDREVFVEFYARVSDQSKYYRFFSPMPKLSDRDVDRFTHVDNVDRVALVLTLQGRIIAVGRYDAVTGSASCCSSTSPRPAASAGSSGSSPRCCPTTPG
jgi:hypothetical protein